jgi:hypothetical protein
VSHRLRLPTVALVAVGVTAACGQAIRLRMAEPPELVAMDTAAAPVLRELGYGGGRSCRIGAVVNEVPERDVRAVPSSDPATCLVLVTSSGALALPTPELRALFAHDLAHAHLGHSTRTGRRLTTRAGAGMVYEMPQQRPYAATEERDADAYAARLLLAVGGAVGCQALAAVLERAATEAGRWPEWSDKHPTAPERPEAVRRLCAAGRR